MERLTKVSEAVPTEGGIHPHISEESLAAADRQSYCISLSLSWS